MKKLEDIKITMLGTTGAGKTSYLLGMYAVMQTGVQGFTLSAKDIDMDLDLTERWEQLISLEGEDRWPAPNAAATEHYAFDFSYGFRPLIGFEWLDYRGLALSDRSGQVSFDPETKMAIEPDRRAKIRTRTLGSAPEGTDELEADFV